MSLTTGRLNSKRQFTLTSTKGKKPKLRRDPGPDKNVIPDDVLGVFADAATREERQRSQATVAYADPTDPKNPKPKIPLLLPAPLRHLAPNRPPPPLPQG